MGSVFGPLELTGAPEPPIVHRAAHAIHMQMRSRGGGEWREGSGVEGGVGPGCVIQQMTGPFAPPHANVLSRKLLFGFTDSCPTARPSSPLLHPHPLQTHTHTHTHNLRTSPSTPKHTHKHNHAYKVLEEKVKKSQRKIDFCSFSLFNIVSFQPLQKSSQHNLCCFHNNSNRIISFFFKHIFSFCSTKSIYL